MSICGFLWFGICSDPNSAPTTNSQLGQVPTPIFRLCNTALGLFPSFSPKRSLPHLCFNHQAPPISSASAKARPPKSRLLGPRCPNEAAPSDSPSTPRCWTIFAYSFFGFTGICCVHNIQNIQTWGSRDLFSIFFPMFLFQDLVSAWCTPRLCQALLWHLCVRRGKPKQQVVIGQSQ